MKYFRDATQLIRQALTGLARVTPSGDTIVLSPFSGPATTLRLKPWREASEQAGEEGVLWVIPRASRRLTRYLRDRGASFVVLSGTVRIQAPGIAVDRGDLKPTPRTESRETRSPFADKASQLARTLFDGNEEQVWTMSSLAEEAGVAASTATYVVSALRELGLVNQNVRGRERLIALPSKRRLIHAWVRHYSWSDNTTIRCHAPIGSPLRFLRRLVPQLSGLRWATTMHAGASLLRSYTNVSQVAVYMGVDSVDGIEDLAMRQGWQRGDEGRLLLMLPKYGQSVWTGIQDIGGIPVVSTLQMILDLWHHPLRGREHAELLLDGVLEAE